MPWDTIPTRATATPPGREETSSERFVVRLHFYRRRRRRRRTAVYWSEYAVAIREYTATFVCAYTRYIAYSCGSRAHVVSDIVLRKCEFQNNCPPPSPPTVVVYVIQVTTYFTPFRADCTERKPCKSDQQ